MLKKYLIVLFCVSSSLFSQTKTTFSSIREIFKQPEDSIDLGNVCLLLAKDAYPDLNIDRFNYAIDYMVDRIKYLNKGITDPIARVGLLNAYFFLPGWWNDSITFTYDLDDLEARKTTNQFLNGYIATKKGSCITMAMLYLVIADRLGWPIKPVRSTQHFFCRYIQEGLKYNNIEATCGGGYISDSQYVHQVGIPQKAIDNGVYLRTLTKNEYIASILQVNSGYFYRDKHDLENAARYARLSIDYDSTFSMAYWNLGEFYREKSIQLDSLRKIEIKDAHSMYEFEMSGPQGNRVMPNTIQGQNRYSELEADLMGIRDKYDAKIEQLITTSRGLKSIAKELGIVRKFPDEFFRKQGKAIEEFKRTGKY